MSIASVVDADYSTVIEIIRGHIGRGTQMSAYEMRQALSVIKNAASRCSTAATPSSNMTTHYATQIAILVAKGSADASAEIATAKTVLDADATALIAATATVPTYTSSTVADG